jgi:hypothetical protein
MKSEQAPKANAQREDWPDLLRLPLMLGVVLIHAYDPLSGGALSLQGHDHIADQVMYFFSQILGRLSVPIFFYFSGFFFYRQLSAPSFTVWLGLIGKRVRTLFVPFLFWNVLTLLTFLALYKFGGGGSPGSSSERVGSADLVGKLVLLFDNNGSPISYQFWFIRDLMICLLLSVFTIPLGRWWFGALTAVIGVCWLVGVWPVAVPTAPSVFFFLLGGFACRATNTLFLNRVPYWIALMYAIGILLELFFRDVLGDVAHRLFLFFGVLSAYWLATLLGRSAVLKQFFKNYGAAAFFLFAAHEPLLSMIKKVVFKIALRSPGLINILLAYLIPPIVVCIVILIAWRILRRFAPGLLAFATGGR